jgi:hypothetical protein
MLLHRGEDMQWQRRFSLQKATPEVVLAVRCFCLQPGGRFFSGRYYRERETDCRAELL